MVAVECAAVMMACDNVRLGGIMGTSGASIEQLKKNMKSQKWGDARLLSWVEDFSDTGMLKPQK